MLEELHRAGAPGSDVRLVSGTTVLLFDRLGSGRFSERLFYRLNVLHVVEGEASQLELS
jgi:DNA-binding NtrC family response regulator